MKKQLLIAAVAATMSVSALADISITGAASAKWTHTDSDVATTANTNVYAQDLDITITGTSGATTVTATVDLGDVTNAVVGEVKMTTSLMGIDLTITDDDPTVEFIASTEIAGVTLTFEDSNANANGSVKGSIDVAGATVTVKQAETKTTTTVTGDMGGITGTYENVSATAANADSSKVEISGSALGSTLTVTSYSGESATAAYVDLDTDSADANESTEGTVVKLVTDLGGNSVTITSTEGQYRGTAKADRVTIEGTRALESGADLTATYTTDDYANNNSVALKIAVSF